METDQSRIWKYTTAFGLSLACASVLSALLVVAKELNPNTVMVWMQRLTGHHWVTHTLAALIIFLALGLTVAGANVGRGITSNTKYFLLTVGGGVVVSYCIIAGFYLIHG
jgi:hypothetical protein